MIRTFAEAQEYLKSREKFGIKFGLENISRLSERLGRPERSYPSILIAGTNGKGSTAALLGSVLETAGLRVGRYTSPHIRRLSERISVNGDDVTDEALTSLVGRVAAAAGDNEPTFFEAVTMCAFGHFAEERVDIAVLEVGMGGRWDATNIAPAKISVITPIGFDHERFLGDTLEDIASEKAAIIKTERPVVVGSQLPEALEVIRRQAAQERARLVLASEGARIAADERETHQLVDLETPARRYRGLTLPLLGAHQRDNLLLAVRVAELAHPEITDDDVRRGVARTRWPGRLERVAGSPPLLMDAAHNIMAAERLGAYLERHPRKGRVLLFGVMKDKRVYEMLAELLPRVDRLVATRPEMSRAKGPEPLARWAREHGTPAEAVVPSSRALERAQELAGPEGEVVVAGSIFLLGEIASALSPSSAAGEAGHTAARTPA